MAFQGGLQIENVVDDVLEDLHLAQFLVRWDARYQRPQAGVAAPHVVQKGSGCFILARPDLTHAVVGESAPQVIG